MQISSRWKNATFWWKKNDRTSYVLSFLLGKALEKQTKAIRNQGKKKVKGLKNLKPEEDQQNLTSI